MRRERPQDEARLDMEGGASDVTAVESGDPVPCCLIVPLKDRIDREGRSDEVHIRADRKDTLEAARLDAPAPHGLILVRETLCPDTAVPERTRARPNDLVLLCVCDARRGRVSERGVVTMPRISVILPVYNGAEHLMQAVETVLGQTLSDLELIVIDDASTDSGLDVLDAVNDPRMVIHVNATNQGLAATLNIGLDLAQGEFVARQDQDDYSAPRRFETQVGLLESSPNVGLVGTWASILRCDERGHWVAVGGHHHPAADPVLRWRLLWNSPFVHSSVMMRRTTVQAVDGYPRDPAQAWPEDYELWSRIANVARIANVPEVLQFYRQSPGGLSAAKREHILEGVIRVGSRNLARALSAEPDDPDIKAIVSSLNGVRGTGSGPRAVLRRVQLLGRAARSIPNLPRDEYPREVWPTQARLMANAYR